MDISTVLRLANCLTISRIFMVPFFMLSFRYERMVPALVVFVVASLTDFFDGRIARKRGITSFGKFMDPLADKLLVGAALICLTRFKGGLIPGWMVMVIIGRELVVTLLRVAFIRAHGTVVSASIWGKYKTSSQMTVITISLVLLVLHENQAQLGRDLGFIIQPQGPIYYMMYLPLILTVVSGLEFLYNNRKALHDLTRSIDSYDPTDDI
jgi:CDP-diacylglycerol---glycerol-3-phosphate 3-phosphatidyltransferase